MRDIERICCRLYYVSSTLHRTIETRLLLSFIPYIVNILEDLVIAAIIFSKSIIKSYLLN